ncbi:MAG: dihydroorotase [Natronomonas sp.]
MLIRNATLADTRVRDVLVEEETIAAVGEDLESGGEEILDVDEKLLLPGMIDVHVHFREPGASHKETWGTGSRSAAAGGVTTVVDQPNTDPPTTDRFGFEMKERFANSSSVDFGINGGVTGDWDPDSLFEKPLFALGEVFLADSTGEMGIDTALFETALEYARKKSVPVTVHAEDETLFDESVTDRTDADAWSDYRTAVAEYEAIERACRVAHEMDTRIHIAHTSTPEGVDIATDRGMTCEATPHHLFLSREDLESLGTYGRMNPPLRSETRRRRLFDRLVDGTIDIVATDHAPHTREEKEASIWDAPSGVPGVETALPLLLEAAQSGPLDYERIREVTSTNPAEIFDLPAKGKIEPGRDADLVLFDTENTTTIRGENLHSKCEWTPFDGRVGIFPEWTMLRGTIVYQHGRFTEGTGRNVHT